MSLYMWNDLPNKIARYKDYKNFMKYSSLYTATKLFNALPENLRIENNINSFTRGIAHIYPLPF